MAFKENIIEKESFFKNDRGIKKIPIDLRKPKLKFNNALNYC